MSDAGTSLRSMAPPVEVITPEKARKRLGNVKDCPLKSLTQFECGIYDGEVVCAPFKRLFHM